MFSVLFFKKKDAELPVMDVEWWESRRRSRELCRASSASATSLVEMTPLGAGGEKG